MLEIHILSGLHCNGGLSGDQKYLIGWGWEAELWETPTPSSYIISIALI